MKTLGNGLRTTRFSYASAAIPGCFRRRLTHQPRFAVEVAKIFLWAGKAVQVILAHAQVMKCSGGTRFPSAIQPVLSTSQKWFARAAERRALRAAEHGTPSDRAMRQRGGTQFGGGGACSIARQPLDFRFEGGDLLVQPRGRGRRWISFFLLFEQSHGIKVNAAIISPENPMASNSPPTPAPGQRPADLAKLAKAQRRQH